MEAAVLGTPQAPSHLILQSPRMATGNIIICTFHRGKPIITEILELANSPKRHRSDTKARAHSPFDHCLAFPVLSQAMRTIT